MKIRHINPNLSEVSGGTVSLRPPSPAPRGGHQVTAKTLHHRARGYARASMAYLDAFLSAKDAPCGALDALRLSEYKAWLRLPLRARQAIQCPMEVMP